MDAARRADRALGSVLGPLAASPRWAPVGDTIAYLAGVGPGEIWLVHASDAGARRVSPPGRLYDPGIDWSPDGRWVIARGPNGLELVEVATGRVVALADVPRGLAQPAWKR
jgi:Tol biopolymer transport system component